MLTGAIKAPMVEPALKMEVENARSFLGKYSAVTLMAAGKFPASPAPKTIRAAMK
ncbi:unknown [Bacteroides sp. CAG:1076]|nr:unknown [Bacteroides sp. CAG:1076]